MGSGVSSTTSDCLVVQHSRVNKGVRNGRLSGDSNLSSNNTLPSCNKKLSRREQQETSAKLFPSSQAIKFPRSPFDCLEYEY